MCAQVAEPACLAHFSALVIMAEHGFHCMLLLDVPPGKDGKVVLYQAPLHSLNIHLQKWPVKLAEQYGNAHSPLLVVSIW